MNKLTNQPMSLGDLLRAKLGYNKQDHHSLLMTIMRCTPNSIRARRGDLRYDPDSWFQCRFILTARELYQQLEGDERALDYKPSDDEAPVFYQPVPLRSGLCVYSYGKYVMFTHNVGADGAQMELLLTSLGFTHEVISVKELRTTRSALLDGVLISGYQRLTNVIRARNGYGAILRIQRTLSEEYGHP